MITPTVSGLTALVPAAGNAIIRMRRHDAKTQARVGIKAVSNRSRRINTHKAATNVAAWAIMVAMAAPSISSRGAPNRPKIRIGSSRPFSNAAPIMIKPGMRASPVARIRALPTIGTTMNTIETYQIRI